MNNSKNIEAVAEELHERLGAPCVVLITIDLEKGMSFSISGQDDIALHVPPVLWVLANYFAQQLGVELVELVDDVPETAEGTLPH